MDISSMLLVFVVTALFVMLLITSCLPHRSCGLSVLCLVALVLVAAMLIGFLLGIVMELNP